MTKLELINRIKNEFASIYSIDDLKRICGMVSQPMDVKEIISALDSTTEEYFKDAIVVDLASAKFGIYRTEVLLSNVELKLDREKFEQDLYDLFVLENNTDLISNWIDSEIHLDIITKEIVIDTISILPDRIITVIPSDDQVSIIYNHINNNYLTFDTNDIEVELDSEQRLVLKSVATSIGWSLSSLKQELRN